MQKKARLTGREIRALLEAAAIRLAGEIDPRENSPSALEDAAGKLRHAGIWLPFSRSEASAVLKAVGQMTGGNSYDFEEWKKSTSGTHTEWNALLRAEAKLREAAT